jgi:N-methylhydantoinase A/oxoprolinase/acetone carboxylase beta subunit
VPLKADIRLGVDVGGTHTDAVLVDPAASLLAKNKVPTTPDVTTGIENAIAGLLAQKAADPARVTHVMLGTTHATNAVLERRGLERTAVLRIGGPATHSIPPLFGWPDELRKVISVAECIVNGGSEFDGRELADFDADGVARFITSLPANIGGVAISSVFAPVSAAHELRAAEIIRRERGPDFHVSLSHEIGTIGLLERENATVLNEALVPTARRVVAAVRHGIETSGLGQSVVFFAQNDGTLMPLDQAMHFPILTIGSGPANSIRGAAYLSGVRDAVVVDVGGTSTDIGVLVNGFPRESTLGVEIGGISTNFRMPDLVSMALGGGTIVRRDTNSPDGVAVGPDSVGYRLRERAYIFGGDTMTLSDAAVAAGRTQFGSAPAVADEILTAAMSVADEMIADGIDRVKTSREDVPVIAVGGGSVLLPQRMVGVSDVIRPADFDVANAIGAAIGTVSGQLDRVYQQTGRTRQEIIDDAIEEATGLAVKAGADPDRVSVVELEEIPLAYLTNPAVRLRVKAAGQLPGL